MARGPSACEVARRDDPRERGRSSAAARSTRPSSCSFRVWATRMSSSALGVDVVHDLPGRRREPAGPPRGLHPVLVHAARVGAAVAKKWKRPLIGAQWLFFRSGPGATNHFEAGGFVRSNDEVAYPNLMFHFLPVAIRYDGSSPSGEARLPGARRADVLRRSRLGEDRLDRPARASRAPLRLCRCSNDRRGWIEAVRVARGILNQPRSIPTTARDLSRVRLFST